MKFLKIFEKKFTYWGVDISEEDLRCAKLDTDTKVVTDILKIESGSNFTQFGLRIENLERGFSILKEKIKIEDSTVINVCLPAQFTVPKNIPLTDKKSVESDILAQIPFPLESVYYDYVITQRDSQVAVFLAVKREIADIISSILVNQGLKPGVLESEYFSAFNLVNFCRPDLKDMVTVILFVHQTYTLFIVTSMGIPVSYSDARIGYRNVMEDDLLDVDLEWGTVQKWLLKQDGDISVDAQVKIKNSINKLSDEVCKNLNLLKHLPELKDGLDKIIVVGDMANNSEFLQSVQTKVGVDVKAFSPFDYLKSKSQDLSFVNAFGVALRRFGDKND